MAASAMKRLLSSPLNFSRGHSGEGRPQGMSQMYFGVPLLDIVRHEGTAVPNLVTKIASFILERGLDQVGIFRVNGNAKVVERLRTSFDRSGDAVLTDTTDVMAIAGLLKLFLRELPDTLIPEHLTSHFVAAQEASVKDPEHYLGRIKNLLLALPDCNYATLKYLTAFLVLVSREENVNKMNSNALATIFGPNMFRCMSGLSGLKEQGLTNCITLQFIIKYNDLFLETGERSPYGTGFSLSDVMLLKPSSVACQRLQPQAQLIFQAVDVVDRAQQLNNEEADNITDSSSPLQQQKNNSVTMRVKSQQPSASPVLTLIQEAIHQAILEHVFGETLQKYPVSSEIFDESDNSWSFSDDDESIKATAAAKASDTDSLTESETSFNESDDDSHRSKQRDTLAKRSTVGEMMEKKPASDVKHYRPGSGSASPLNRIVEPVSAYRATSAPISWSSASGMKTHTGMVDVQSERYRQMKETANSNQTSYQGVAKFQVTEKQGKLWLNNPQSSSNDYDQPHLQQQSKPWLADKTDPYLNRFKQLTKQIHVCKKKLKEFEEDFEEEHGYKPMHSDKVNCKEMRACLKELHEARKQLSDLREVMDAIREGVDQEPIHHGKTMNIPISLGKKVASGPSMEDTLSLLMVKLKDKRQTASRPENLSEMTKEEICDEKLCIQKALLHFETMHGRPSTPGEKELMHPLYDRYRKIKRILAKQTKSGDDVDDIHTETGNLSFVSTCTQSTMAGSKGTIGRQTRNVPNQSSSTNPLRNIYTTGRDSLHKPADLGQYRKVGATSTNEVVGRMLNDDENLNFNQLSLPRLMSELQRTKADKKRLQVVLHNFEEAFQKEHGRKIQKHDQLPLESEYKQYKTIKAKLKLLEVLMAKHQQTN